MNRVDAQHNHSREAREKIGPLARGMYLLATIQVAWYYLGHVPSYMYLYRYENGLDRMPFQGRLLMMFFLRWAHSSAVCIALASALKRFAPWTLPQILPGSIPLLLVDTVCILVTGVVASRIYQASSKARLLTLWIYPMVLILCVAAYILHTTQNLSYYYDFPSLMFFSVGLYLIYFRRHAALFAGWFLLGTVNRETTLMLLLFFVLAHIGENGHVEWSRLRDLRIWGVIVSLAAAWLAWHAWVGWVFRANATELSWRLAVNIGLVVFPLSWPQLLAVGCYMVPAFFIFRRSVKDPTLRIWLWTLPAWFGLMFVYGVLIETRIFGELTVYFACLTALIAEQALLETMKKRGWVDRYSVPQTVEAARVFPASGDLACASKLELLTKS